MKEGVRMKKNNTKIFEGYKNLKPRQKYSLWAMVFGICLIIFTIKPNPSSPKVDQDTFDTFEEAFYAYMPDTEIVYSVEMENDVIVTYFSEDHSEFYFTRIEKDGDKWRGGGVGYMPMQSVLVSTNEKFTVSGTITTTKNSPNQVFLWIHVSGYNLKYVPEIDDNYGNTFPYTVKSAANSDYLQVDYYLVLEKQIENYIIYIDEKEYKIDLSERST